jgi:hypothetical protein
LNVVEKYFFTITATAQGGSTITSPTLTLDVKCGPTSTSVSNSDNPLATTQAYQVAGSGDIGFEFAGFKSSLAVCVIETYVASDS